MQSSSKKRRIFVSSSFEFFAFIYVATPMIVNATARVLNYVHHFMHIKDMADSHPLGIHAGFNDNSQDIFVVLKYRIDCMLE